jgi:hypothetical protein
LNVDDEKVTEEDKREREREREVVVDRGKRIER